MIDVEKTKAAAEKLAGKRELLLVVLFGSQATGKTHAESDVDIAVLANHPLSPSENAQLQFNFSEELKRGDIEIVDLKTAPPLLLKKVAEEGILLFESEKSFFTQMQIYFLKLYMEAKPLFKMREIDLARSLKPV